MPHALMQTKAATAIPFFFYQGKELSGDVDEPRGGIFVVTHNPPTLRCSVFDTLYKE